MYVPTGVCIYECVYVRVCVCMSVMYVGHVCIYIYICMDGWILARMYEFESMYVCMYVCMYVGRCTNTHTYIHT